MALDFSVGRAAIGRHGSVRADGLSDTRWVPTRPTPLICTFQAAGSYSQIRYSSRNDPVTIRPSRQSRPSSLVNGVCRVLEPHRGEGRDPWTNLERSSRTKPIRTDG